MIRPVSRVQRHRFALTHILAIFASVSPLGLVSGVISREKAPLRPMLAINILKWPGMNQAFLFSFAITNFLGLLVIPFGKRRRLDRKATWGEAMIGGVLVFAVLFLAFGVVPHQWIDHADRNLGWRKDKIVYGPFGLLKPQVFGGPFPFTISYEAIRDIIVVVIHGVYIGLMIYLFSWWQKRAVSKPTEIATSTYGRPLLKKS